MKLINELKKEESKDKPKCEIKFEKVLLPDGEIETTIYQPKDWNYVSLLAHLSKNKYIFEAYDCEHHPGTDKSTKYIGTLNGVEQ